jgi:hypothetical protein
MHPPYCVRLALPGGFCRILVASGIAGDEFTGQVDPTGKSERV